MSYQESIKQREYQRRWMKARRAAFFAGTSCVKCGSAGQLELDHIDPTKKVSHRIWSWTASRRVIEIAKCQVLCTVCHKAKTAAAHPMPEHGTMGRYAKRGCRCGACRAANAFRVRCQRQAVTA